MAITRATNLAGLGTVFDALTDGGGLSISGISTFTDLNVTGLGTFPNGPVLIGSATSTGTASQPLQVTGGAYVSGNIGIGSTDPDKPFVLKKANPGNYVAEISNTQNSINANGLYVNTTDTNATTQALNVQGSFVVDGTGNVGVGSDRPTLQLDTLITTANLASGTVLTSHPIAQFINSSAGQRGLEIGSPSGGMGGPVYLKVSGTANRFAILNQSDNEDLTIFSGNVGIATAAPASKLSVSGDIRVQNSSNVSQYLTVTYQGINFENTGVAGTTSSAHLLDDYEEGTWTPRIRGTSGGDYTPAGANVGWYRKVGNIVHVGGTIHWSATVTPYSGNLGIFGLPYATSTLTQARSAGSIGAPATPSISFTAGHGSWSLVTDPGQTFIYIIQIQTDGEGYSHGATVSSTGIIYGIGITYLTD